jgi:polyisoprenoid-binding protein YceI
MKYTILLSFCFLLLAFGPKNDVYTIDKKASTVKWLAKKTTGQHSGEAPLQSGSLIVEKNVPVGGEFVLNMAAITVTDVADAESNAKLATHLKGEDFFEAAKYPTATLSIKQFDKIAKPESDEANYTATADLAIKGITNPIQFPARIDFTGGLVNASANITIDRTKWNITYKSKSVLGAMADKFIYDDIAFSVKLVMQKQK